MSDECKYTCEFCGKSFCRPCACAVHKRGCSKNPSPQTKSKDGGWCCRVCHNYFRTRKELQVHRQEANHTKAVKSRSIYECKFCHKIWETTKEGGSCHERYCIDNPNRIVQKPHVISEDTRRRISEKQKSNYKGRACFNINRSQEPYSEKYFREWLEKEHIEYKKNYNVDRFFLDFAFPDKQIYFEINGEQHYRKMYNGRDHQEYDKERESILFAQGWRCIAHIRWSKFCALSIDERSNMLSCLRAAIYTASVADYAFSYNTDKLTEYHRLKDEAIKLGKINCLGRICNNKITDEEMLHRKNTITNSGIDLTKFGWVEKVSKVTGLSRRQIYKVVNSTDLINYVYRR